MVTGQDHAFVQHNWLAFAHLFHFGITRYTARSRRRLIDVSVHQTEFQRRGCAQNFFRTSGVLNTRQFNHDAVSTLTLNQRLSHAQLVYTVTQDIDVLLNGVFTRFAQTRIGHDRAQSVTALAGDHHIAMARGQIADGFIARRAVAEHNADAIVIFFTHVGVRDALLTQIATQAVGILFLELTEGGIHVHFHQEVHAATQVETEFHRLGVDGG